MQMGPLFQQQGRCKRERKGGGEEAERADRTTGLDMAGRQAGGRAGRQACRQKGRRAGRHADIQVGGQASRQVGRWSGWRSGRRPGRQAGGQAGGQAGRLVVRQAVRQAGRSGSTGLASPRSSAMASAAFLTSSTLKAGMPAGTFTPNLLMSSEACHVRKECNACGASEFQDTPRVPDN